MQDKIIIAGTILHNLFRMVKQMSYGKKIPKDKFFTLLG